MFNFRRFFYQAVPQSEPDASSESESLLVSHDVEKAGLLFPQQTTSKKPRQLTFVVKLIFLTSIFASAIFFGQPIAEFAARTYNIVMHCGGSHQQTPIVDQAPGMNISQSVAAAT